MRAITAYVNARLPPDLRDPNRILDSKGVGRLLAEAADRYPDKYTGILKMLGDTGRKSAYVMGETVRLEDLESPFDKSLILKQMTAEMDVIDANVALTPEARKAQRKEVMGKFSDALERQTMDAGNLNGNSITRSVASGARGKPLQVKAMIASPGVYADFKGNIVPVFSAQSYAEGLRPAAYLASTYGARAAVVSTKAATARGGDIGKQMSQTLSDQVVTARDCGTANGIDIAADDPSVEGRVLQKAAGPFPAGTFVNSRVATALKKQGGNIVVRSALTCAAHQGICAKCAGASFGNKELPAVGTMAGIRASQALSEPVTQGSLNVKHVSGAYKGKKSFSGLNVIEQFVQAPEEFPNRASVAERDGHVDAIEDAPQGGKYITVDGEKHYVLPDFEPIVKVGERVEAGDQLSGGLVDPKDKIRLQGLGAGRLYYAQRLKQILDDSGHDAHLRNTELMARGAIDHVEIDDDGFADYLPADVASYNSILSKYTPPETARTSKLSAAVGKYLATPVLHYTIGTRITPSLAKRAKESGYDEALIDDSPPAFKPVMTRLRTQGEDNPDWIDKQTYSYVKSNLMADAVRGRDSNIESNIHYAPRQAVGVGFGDNLKETGKW